MAIGAGIGALAGVAVYGAKVALSKETRWSWKAAAAHAAGGLVGGGLFPPVLAGLAAAGLPTAAAYVLAGGLAWGGIWTAAQDAAAWALGDAPGMAEPKKYLVATGIGLAATALLLPLAARAVGPGLRLAPHAGQVANYVTPSSRAVAANVVKSEAEFLAFGALSETASAGVRHAGRLAAARAATAKLVPKTLPEVAPEVAAPHLRRAPPALPSSAAADPRSPFGAYAARLAERGSSAEDASPPPPPSGLGRLPIARAGQPTRPSESQTLQPLMCSGGG